MTGAALAPRRSGTQVSGPLLVVALVALGAALVWGLRRPPPPDPRADPAAHAQQARSAELRQRFEQAVVMLHAGQHEHAVTALHRVLQLAPKMPEAHVNVGYALMGLGRAAAARDFFNGAIEIEPSQANAYYGLALAWEALGDLRMALGAMRSYLHLARQERDDHLRRARAALWEWESRLQRGEGVAAGQAASAARPSAPCATVPASGNRFPTLGGVRC